MRTSNNTVIHGAPQLSVVIPTYSRVSILKQCLDHLANQKISMNLFEVLVIDDRSEDNTIDFLSSYKPPYLLRYFLQKANKGPAAARNTGILAAGGSIIVFINDDTLLEPDALAVHLIVHQKMTDMEVSVLGRFDLSSFFTKSLWGYILQNSDLLFRYPPMKNNNVYPHTHYWTCNISTSRKALLEAGLFDERFSGNAWGAEDQELGKRLFDNGVPVLFREDCKSIHHHSLTVEGFTRMSIIRGGGGVLMFSTHQMKPHYSRIREEDILFWQNLPRRLVERMEQFKHVIGEAANKFPLKKLTESPYLYKEEYLDIRNICFSLWSIRTREIIKLMEKFESQAIHIFNCIDNSNISMEYAAKHFYPIVLFLRFFYDTIGVCGIDSIKKIVNTK
jgi:glycosyltransferase involved in cell wall biosynthesis